MDVLVLGGTTFVGRHIVQALLGEGHTVTIFTRGMTNTHLFPEAVRWLPATYLPTIPHASTSSSAE